MRLPATRLAVLVGAFCTGLLVGACGGRQATLSADEYAQTLRMRYGNIDRDLMTSESVDLNEDGEPDQVRYYLNGTLFMIERDLNFDGRPDLFEYYDSSGALVEQELQLDFDPAIDVVRIYRRGVLTQKLVSVEYDGSFTLWKYYDAQGNLLRVERDSNYDGHVDIWEYYEDGRLVRVGRDVDGDRTPDFVDVIN